MNTSTLNRLKARLGQALLAVVLPVSVLVFWWFASERYNSVFFPPLRESVTQFGESWFGGDGEQVLITFVHFLAGFGIGAILGVALGVVLGLLPTARMAVAPVLEFARALPAVALVPAALVIFGLGARMEIVIIAFGAMWPVLLNTIEGVRGIDQTMKDACRISGLSGPQRLRRLILPSAMPQIFAGLQTGIGVGLAITIVASMFGGVNGVGFYILQALRFYDIPSMWAGIFALALIGLLCGGLLDFIERRKLVWYRGWLGSLDTETK